MKLSSRIKLLAEAEEVLNQMKKPVEETSLNEAAGDIAFPNATAAFEEYKDYLKKSSSLKSKITKAFSQEVQKYLRGGRWDIIVAPGNERWGGERKTMENDTINWYNAKIKNIYIEQIGVAQTSNRSRKAGEPAIYFGIHADGDNLAYDGYADITKVKIYKAYQSPEGKEYKKGY